MGQSLFLLARQSLIRKKRKYGVDSSYTRIKKGHPKSPARGKRGLPIILQIP